MTEVDPRITPHNVHDCESWGDLKSRLDNIEIDFDPRRSLRPRARHTALIYRGLPDSSYTLSTTLERSALEIPEGPARVRALSVHGYMQAALIARTSIESERGERWSLDENRWFNAAEKIENPTKLFTTEDLRYLLHIRHHGFPSPFLDWTESPFVAAFFAFRSSAAPSSGRVSIRAYRSVNSSGGRIMSPRGHFSDTLGTTIPTHPRHHRQRAQYTYAISQNLDHFVNFEEAIGNFSQPPARGGGLAQALEDQDLQWNFTLPWSERSTVLRDLDRMNIHAFSLFGSEDSLMETLASREYSMIAREFRPDDSEG